SSVIVMDRKGPKQKLQCSQENEDSIKNERKRPRSDDSEDEFQQFFALVDRIQEKHRLCKQNGMKGIFAREILTIRENVCANIIVPISPWKPAFEHEDFCGPAWKGNRDLTSCEEKNVGSSAVTEKQESDKYMAVEIFDLNVEAAS
ncbi:hypothetical protein KI387_035674, partial [Taxus chinensis]